MLPLLIYVLCHNTYMSVPKYSCTCTEGGEMLNLETGRRRSLWQKYEQFVYSKMVLVERIGALEHFFMCDVHNHDDWHMCFPMIFQKKLNSISSHTSASHTTKNYQIQQRIHLIITETRNYIFKSISPPPHTHANEIQLYICSHLMRTANMYNI